MEAPLLTGQQNRTQPEEYNKCCKTRVVVALAALVCATAVGSAIALTLWDNDRSMLMKILLWYGSGAAGITGGGIVHGAHTGYVEAKREGNTSPCFASLTTGLKHGGICLYVTVLLPLAIMHGLLVIIREHCCQQPSNNSSQQHEMSAS